jgi:hypothetical protein
MGSTCSAIFTPLYIYIYIGGPNRLAMLRSQAIRGSAARTGDGKTGIGNGGHALIGPYGLGLGSLLWRGHGLPLPLALAHGGFCLAWAGSHASEPKP